jgi:3-isopropylmalate/(R)-2-methylmalate dehydratase small subunit
MSMGPLTCIRGRAFRFGSNVTTDDILPGKYLDRANVEVGALAMSGIDPDFAKRVHPGDMIVAGANFGMGSGRESAPMALKLAGLGAIVAPSFSRLFFRNCINLGLPAAIVEGLDGIEAGERLTLDLVQRTLVCDRSGRSMAVLNLTGTSRAILDAGGIVPFTKARRAASPAR